MTRRPLVLLLAFALAACADDDEVGGTYRLVSVGGDRVPAEMDAFGLSGAVVDGSVRVTADSVWWTEDFDAGDTGYHFAIGTTYSRDGGALRAEPHAVDPVPDDLFIVCLTAGVYRVEDDGDELRMIDVVQDGECEEPTTYDLLERVYRRD